ncbi:MAG: RNase H family protein [Tepidiformaceae bacterium]
MWIELERLSKVHDIEWKWVKGHANSPEHNRCDVLAVAARQALARGESPEALRL